VKPPCFGSVEDADGGTGGSSAELPTDIGSDIFVVSVLASETGLSRQYRVFVLWEEGDGPMIELVMRTSKETFGRRLTGTDRDAEADASLGFFQARASVTHCWKCGSSLMRTQGRSMEVPRPLSLFHDRHQTDAKVQTLEILQGGPYRYISF